MVGSQAAAAGRLAMPPDVLVPEPGNFFEAQAAQEKIAKFSGGGAAADGAVAVQSAGVNDKPQEMQMLVAVRMRPLWQKEDDAGDQRCVSVLQGKVVNVIDPSTTKSSTQTARRRSDMRSISSSTTTSVSSRSLRRRPRAS